MGRQLKRKGEPEDLPVYKLMVLSFAIMPRGRARVNLGATLKAAVLNKLTFRVFLWKALCIYEKNIFQLCYINMLFYRKEGSPKEVLTYENIEKVYKTIVVVKKNPINSKPFVILVSGVN